MDAAFDADEQCEILASEMDEDGYASLTDYGGEPHFVWSKNETSG